MAKVSFLGLGVMGYPMAGHLAKSGHDVTVYNRTKTKTEKWLADFKGNAAETPAMAAINAEYIFACVGNDNDLKDITLAKDGAFQTMRRDSMFVDHTTASATVSRQLYAEALRKGFHFLDAPVSGGQAGAEKGTLTIMAGGDQSVCDRARSIIKAYGKSIQYMGESGAGQLTKMVNQICIAGTLQGLAEGINFAKSAGLNVSTVLDAISKGAAGSWQMDNRGQTMSDSQFNFGFAVDWMRKDLGICLDQADQQGVSLPVTALINQFFAELQQMGYSRSDTSSLIMRLLPSRQSS